MKAAPDEPPSTCHRRRPHRDDRQHGAVSVLVAALLPALLALAALVIEVGGVLVAHRELLDAADAAARAGATAIDLEAYRASDGQTTQLDPQRANQTAWEHLQANRYSGPASITATTTSITLTLTRTHPPLLFGFVAPVRLTATATAVPQTGIQFTEAPP